MAAASEKAYDELPEQPAAASVPEVIAPDATSQMRPRHGLAGRVAIVIVVVAVEAAWLALIGYAVWHLVLRG